MKAALLLAGALVAAPITVAEPVDKYSTPPGMVLVDEAKLRAFVKDHLELMEAYDQLGDELREYKAKGLCS